MNTTRQRSSTPSPADRPVWSNRADLVQLQSRWQGESVSSVGSPPGVDGIETFFRHALAALDPDELEDLLRRD